jgi:TPR repeat protein
MLAATLEQKADDVAFFDQLECFFETLRAQGLVVDIEQRVRLNGLLLRLSAEQRLPKDPVKLRRLITPVLAGSPAEQTLCDDTFNTVFARGDSPLRDGSGRKDLANPNNEGRLRNWNRLAWLARGWMGAATAVTAAGLIYFVITHLPLHDRQIQSELQSPRSVPTAILDIDWLKNYPIEELDPPRQSPWNRTWRWYYTEYTPTKWTALLLPWVMLLGFLAWLYYRMLAYLLRERAKQNLRLLDWRVGNTEARFGDRKLLGELQPLRRLARAHILVLDPNRTALASAEAAGLLKPQFSELAVPTNFVAFIDRRSLRDHLADYNGEVVRTMRDAGLSIEILEFNADPTLSYFVRTGEFVRLDAVIQRFPDSILVIFAAAEQLIDPTRRRVLPVALALKDARRAILLTPNSEGTETALEEQLARELGLVILRTTPASVSKLILLLLGIGRKDGANTRLVESNLGAGVEALADFVAERPGRWMQQVEPPKHDRYRLQALLRQALGAAGLRWLAATTVYPELRWPLTLALKSAVGGGTRNALDSELLAVSQLPWFRGGWMPDWTRNLLQRTLTKHEQTRVRRVILEAIGLGHRQSGRQAEDLQIRLAKHGELLNDRVKADRIMLDYLLPALRSSPRLFALPESWAGRLVRKRLRRLAGTATAAVLMTVCLSAVALSLLPIDECDLLASSDNDNLRVGPAMQDRALRTFFADKAVVACQTAIEKEPNNGRFWLGKARALANIDPIRALESARTSASLKHPAGFNALGAFYTDNPNIVVPDLDRAQEYFDTAIKLGNSLSLRNSSVLARKRGDKRREFELLKEYLNSGGSQLSDLALFYRNGGFDFVDKHPDKYIEILELGVKRHDGFSASQLGYEYDVGGYVPKDVIRASQLYESAIRWAVRPAAASNLASSYRLKAEDLEKDEAERILERATYFAIFAAKFGYTDELFRLVETGNARFKEGFGPPASFAPETLIERGAEAGDARLQFLLAKHLEKKANENEKGTDIAEAIAWYRKSAAGGNENAVLALKRLKAE